MVELGLPICQKLKGKQFVVFAYCQGLQGPSHKEVSVNAEANAREGQLRKRIQSQA